MGCLADLVGDTLLSHEGEVATDKVDAEVVFLYFSGAWCGPCQGFTPMLVEWYERLTKAGKSIEVIFVSSDYRQNEFDAYYKKMPWLALPFSEREIKAKLSNKLKVRGIPTLAISNQNGEVYDMMGRGIITSDPDGENFPWLPPTTSEALGEEFVRNDGTKVTREELEGKYIALYFSAHWCGPCRSFTEPVLKPVYLQALADDKPWEIIFVSSDQSKEEFDNYFAEMPWVAVPFEDRARKELLSTRFGVRGIPTLIMLDQDLNVVNKACTNAVMRDPTAANFPWQPKLVVALEDAGGEVNKVPCLIVLMEDENDTTRAQFEAILADVAEEHKERLKDKEGEEQLFLHASESSPVVTQVRKFTKQIGSGETRTLCNGDFCLKLSDSTSVILINIQMGAYYVLEGELTAENIKKFNADFHADKLTPRRFGQ